MLSSMASCRLTSDVPLGQRPFVLCKTPIALQTWNTTNMTSAVPKGFPSMQPSVPVRKQPGLLVVLFPAGCTGVRAA